MVRLEIDKLCVKDSGHYYFTQKTEQMYETY